VSRLSTELGRVILTFDKDFGEIVFKKHIKVIGIILLRFKPKSIDYINNMLLSFFESNFIKNFTNKFIIIDEDKVRIKNLYNNI